MEAAVVSGILKIISNKLAPLLVKEYSLIVGVQKHLLELKDQVQEINCWLEAVGDKVSPDTPANNWLRKLKDISYDVDDIVDEFQLKAEEHEPHGVSVISRYMCKKPKSLILQCKVARKLKAVKKRFDAIVKQRTEFNAIAISLQADHPTRDWSQTTANQTTWPTVDVASVLGRDQEKHQIISKLVDDKHIIKTISIIGLGGSGKTTLAKLVFNDCSIVEKHFEVRLWVHVSQEFDVDKLIKKLFEAFADNNPGQRALPCMIKTISEKLTGKRILVVLDDVWTESLIQWENFAVHLKSCAPGSRILVTTRSRRVAETVQSINQFDLSFLSLDDSWQLFQQSLVIPAEGLGSEFVQVGKEIARKCGGVPLAIKALAGVLRGMVQIQEWKSMRDSNLLAVEGKECIVSACLMLSYLNLPSHLKQCFTLCSVFPKGHRIDKEQLIGLWIAHDMISMDYIGNKHFNSLVQISFLQNVEEKDGRVTCRMHDLVHDLAQLILGEEISLVVPMDEENSIKSCRYFSLREQPKVIVPKNILRKARVMYITGCYDHIFGMALENAKHLRSVIVGSTYERTPLNAVFQIKYLKYLSMSGLNCEAIPDAISDVWSLQALHITNSLYLLGLPESIGKLKKLRTLNLSGCHNLNRLPDSIGDCHMVSNIDLWYCMDLTVLPNSISRNKELRVLRLGCTGVRRLPTIITLENLECLDLTRCYELVELPEGIWNLKKLEVLNIEGCTMFGFPLVLNRQALDRLQNMNIFVVGRGKRSGLMLQHARVADMYNRDLSFAQAYVMEPEDAQMTCLKQKTNLHYLSLRWMTHDAAQVNNEFDKAVLDDLEPPSGIKELGIHGYSGRQYAWWMQSKVGGGVQGPTPFPCLRVMNLIDFPNLKHLHGLVELPCLEELQLKQMPSLESLSGGSFPSLVNLEMHDLPCLGEVWIVAEWIMPDGEKGGGCCNVAPQFGQFRFGNCLTVLKISDCPKLEIKPHLPLSFSHLKELRLQNVKGVGWSLTSLQSLKVDKCSNIYILPESLGELRSLQELTIKSCPSLCSLPQTIGQLTSLQELIIVSCNALNQLPECLGELCSLRKLKITDLPKLTCLPESICRLTTSLQVLEIYNCPGITSLPQGMNGLISLEELYVSFCPAIKSLPEGIKGLTALKKLWIHNCLNLQWRCRRGKGEDWHLISHIPDVFGIDSRWKGA